MASVIAQELPLHLLEAGQTGTVTDVVGTSGLVVRLEEMGLHRGARVNMIRPGSPCILEINHQRYSLRIDEDSMVFVEVGR